MPIYEYKCEGQCGKVFTKYLKVADYQQAQSCCGLIARKIVSAPAVFGDLPGYESPATGQWIEGRKARNEDLKRSGCVPFEPGMREANRKKMEQAQKADERALEAAVQQVASELSN